MKELIGIILVCLVVLSSMFGCVALIERTTCYSKYPNHSVRWGLFSGCLIETNLGWLPADNFRPVDTVELFK